MNSKTAPERLVYKAIAHKNINHTTDGVIYVHHFGTGYQELVFADHAAATRFAQSRDMEISK